MATKTNKTGHGHVFGRLRPDAAGRHPIHVSQPEEQRDTRFRPLPPPTGPEPFRLDLKSIIPAAGSVNAAATVDPTLDGFVRNFCAPQPVKMPESQDSNRTAMTQPNVYWTLLTPLANIVGLYSNVHEGGVVKQPQIDWLENELRALEPEIPIIVALHRPVYSADAFHSGSTHMKQLILKPARFGPARRLPQTPRCSCSRLIRPGRLLGGRFFFSSPKVPVALAFKLERAYYTSCN